MSYGASEGGISGDLGSTVMANKRTAELQKTQSGGSRASSPATSRSETNSSSKTSSPTEHNKSQIDFQFLNFSHPAEAKGSGARKTVRSHVTRKQHEKEHALAAARRAQSYQSAPEPEQPALPQRSHASTFPSERPTTIELPGSSSALNSSPEASSQSPSPSASPVHPAGRRIDPTEIYPEEWHPYIPPIIEYYFASIAIDIPDLDAAEAKGLMRTRFLPFVLTDVAPLHAVMLMATAHYGNNRGARSHTIDLLQLRGMAIREISTAMSDPARARSDQIIAAVAIMASFEALFGDRDIFNTHVTGLLRLVSLRGGLPALGLDGLLARILLWIDSNASHMANSHVYFDKAAFPSTAVHPTPDLRRFVGGSPPR